MNGQINFGNNSNADIAVSIHFNGSENATAHGTEALYSQYNGLTNENIRLSTSILNEVVNATGLSNRGLKDVAGTIGVVRAINKPVTLIECAFVTNVEESQYASDEQKQYIIANAIAKGICQYFGIVFKEVSGVADDWEVKKEEIKQKAINYGLISVEGNHNMNDNAPKWFMLAVQMNMLEKYILKTNA